MDYSTGFCDNRRRRVFDYIAQDYGLSRKMKTTSPYVSGFFTGRYLEHGGTVKDYERWAKLVEGVKWAKSLTSQEVSYWRYHCRR